MSVSYPILLKPYLLPEATDTQVEVAPVERAPPSPWLISPAMDLFFVCGAAPWILGFFALLLLDEQPLTSAPTASQMSFNICFVVASFLIGEAHQFTSILRWWDQVRVSCRNESILIMKPVFRAILLSLGILFCVSNTLGVVLFPVVLMHHVCAQARAVGLLYCGKQNFRLSKLESLVLIAATWSLVAFGTVTIAVPLGLTQAAATFGANGQLIIAQPSPFELGAADLCVLPVLLFSLLMLKRGLASGSWLPNGAAFLWANLAAFVLLGRLPNMIYIWMFVPLFFHATQHWAVAWVTQQKEQAGRGYFSVGFTDRLYHFVRLVIPVQIVTVLILFLPTITGAIPFQSPADSLTLSLNWSMFVFYLHYFADRIVWRPQKKGEGNAFKAA